MDSHIDILHSDFATLLSWRDDTSVINGNNCGYARFSAVIAIIVTLMGNGLVQAEFRNGND